jgi:nicotinamidase-related amidase
VVDPKHYHPGFTQTDPDATCRVRGITRLVVTGPHTSYDAFPRGIQPIAVTDAAAVHQPFADTLSDHALNH